MDLTSYDFNTFLTAYLECAAWASTDCDDEGNGDGNLEGYAFAPEAQAELVRNALGFLASPGVLEATMGREEEAGHDLFLTAARHGAGFWDGDWDEEEKGDMLTKAAHPYAVELYLGDDELIYVV